MNAAGGALERPGRSEAAAARVRGDRFVWLAAPALGYLAALYAIPLLLLLARSLRGADGGLTFAAYAEFLGDGHNLAVVWRTLRVALWTTLLALAIAYPTAFALARARGWVQTAILVAMVLPLSVGVIVKAFAWTILFRADGVLNQALSFLGVVDVPVRMLFTETALVVGAANVFLPFMVLPIYSVVRQMDASHSEAAATLGASAWFRFRYVTLPLSLPGVVAGTAFTFSLAVSMYVIPSLIVGERQQTMSMLIARSFLFLRDESLGSAISVTLLGIAVLVVIASDRLARRLGSASA